LADAWEVPLHCLHVIEEDDITDLAVALDQPLEALVERARAAATQWLAEALAPYSASMGIVANVEFGHSRSSLNRLVRDTDAQLLVLGAHGQEQAAGVGSTALACVRDAHTDVLVVRDSAARRYRALLACTGLGPGGLVSGGGLVGQGNLDPLDRQAGVGLQGAGDGLAQRAADLMGRGAQP
jgi:nucleotide-binding universal stress UspA family protein